MRKEARNYIKTARGKLLSGIGVPEPKPFSPDPFQVEAIQSLSEERDTLVVAPTGTGKTYIAVEAIRHVVASGKRAVYTAPLKALSNTKYGEFKQIFEPEYSVGLLTGDRKIEGDADVVVATTEIYRNELFRSYENYALVVLDEFHYVSDAQRGPVWEESVILSPSSSTLLMLSASISNAEQIADWIQAVRKNQVSIIRESKRPVELRMAMLHPEWGILPLDVGHPEIRKEINAVYNSSRRQFSAPRGPLPMRERKGQKQKQGRRGNRRGRRGRKARNTEE